MQGPSFHKAAKCMCGRGEVTRTPGLSSAGVMGGAGTGHTNVRCAVTRRQVAVGVLGPSVCVDEESDVGGELHPNRTSQAPGARLSTFLSGLQEPFVKPGGKFWAVSLCLLWTRGTVTPTPVSRIALSNDGLHPPRSVGCLCAAAVWEAGAHAHSQSSRPASFANENLLVSADRWQERHRHEV